MSILYFLDCVYKNELQYYFYNKYITTIEVLKLLLKLKKILKNQKSHALYTKNAKLKY